MSGLRRRGIDIYKLTGAGWLRIQLMVFACQASGPISQHRKYIQTEYQFHQYRGAKIPNCDASSVALAGNAICCYLSLLYKRKRENSVRDRSNRQRLAAKRERKTRIEKKTNRKQPSQKLTKNEDSNQAGCTTSGQCGRPSVLR